MNQKPRRLATFVRVAGRKWGPEDDIPPEVAEKITNPKAWAAPEDDDGEPSGAKAGKAGTRVGPRLASYVRVGGRRYGPDDLIPPDVAAKITNPKAWEGGKLPSLTQGGPLPAGVAATGDNPGRIQPGQAAHGVDPVPPVGPVGEVAAPPRTGPGSGVRAWEAFADAKRVFVEPGAKKEEIIAACEQAGVIDDAAQ